MICGPDPNAVFPIENVKSICFIKNVIKNPNIIVGDYTYYSDDKSPENFEKHVTHHYDFNGDKLIIGKFCAIGSGVEFIMNGANHCMRSVTTYPFFIMKRGWEEATPTSRDLPLKGDTVVGNDVWIGQNVTILPGVHIGDGAIIGANTVVGSNVPAYHIVCGNPCRIIRKRFPDDLIAHLEKIQWWNWPPEKISKNLKILCSADLALIRKIEA